MYGKGDLFRSFVKGEKAADIDNSLYYGPIGEKKRLKGNILNNMYVALYLIENELEDNNVFELGTDGDPFLMSLLLRMKDAIDSSVEWYPEGLSVDVFASTELRDAFVQAMYTGNVNYDGFGMERSTSLNKIVRAFDDDGDQWEGVLTEEFKDVIGWITSFEYLSWQDNAVPEVAEWMLRLYKTSNFYDEEYERCVDLFDLKTVCIALAERVFALCYKNDNEGEYSVNYLNLSYDARNFDLSTICVNLVPEAYESLGSDWLHDACASISCKPEYNKNQRMFSF